MAFELHEDIEVIEAAQLLKTPRLLENMDVIVDAVYGTGFHGQVASPGGGHFQDA